MSPLPERKKLDHSVPFWVREDSTHSLFFITICTQPRGLNQLAHDHLWPEFLKSILFQEERGIWVCPLLIAMPDHLHGFFRFEGTARMEQAISNWKRYMARHHQIKWQRNFIDHRIRSVESAAEKRNYILNNPVRAGLSKKVGEWPYCHDAFAEK